LNWCMPVYEVETSNALAFHLVHWSRSVRNSSRNFNYYQWNATNRATAAQHVRRDTRVQPRPEEPIQAEPQLIVVAPVGSVLLFSGAHLHATVPNTTDRTRFSLDFRTVHRDDVIARRGAPNIDSECTGTTLRDFLRA